MGWGGREGQQPASMLPCSTAFLIFIYFKAKLLHIHTHTHLWASKTSPMLRNSGSVPLTQDLPHSGLRGLMEHERLSTGWGREKGAGCTTACHLRSV